MKSASPLLYKLVICGVLIAAILLVYWQTTHHEYVSFDDGLYVTDNRIVQAGITRAGIQWAFGFNDIAYWHPLTWLSHMLDCQLFGLDPGKHHLTSLIIHIANSLLLFFVSLRMTGQMGPSAFVAALFAIHPINVESVAWVAERKNVLSTFFWMLTLLGYAGYARKPSWVRYCLTLVTFACGLMVKPALITLPFVFLILDFWPLRRLHISSGTDTGAHQISTAPESVSSELNLWLLVLEKIPFFIVAGVSIALTLASVQHHDIVVSLTEIPAYLRVANALTAYPAYIAKMVWPANLAVFYPFPLTIPLWYTLAAVIWMLCVSMITLRYWKQIPCLIVGWLWFLGTLLPHVGFVQAGIWPALADRWAYVPFVGLFIMLGWGIPEIWSRFQRRKTGLFIGGGAVILTFTVVSLVQTGYWQNSIRLYQHAVDATDNNDVAHNNLGAAYYDAKRIDKAIFHFVEALRIMPALTAAHDNLNKALAGSKNIDANIKGMRRLMHLYPGLAALHYNLGNLYREKGELNAAIDQYHVALRIKPDFIQAMNNLAGVHVAQGQYSTALIVLKKMAELQPNDAEIYYDLARICAIQNNTTQSMYWLQKAVESGFDDLQRIENDGNLKYLKKTPAYEEFIESLI